MIKRIMKIVGGFMIGFIIFFVFVFILITAFKKNTSETTVTKKDENGNIITEHHETVNHTAGQSAARFVVGLVVVGIIIAIIFICSII